jgi:hypothetical protein
MMKNTEKLVKRLLNEFKGGSPFGGDAADNLVKGNEDPESKKKGNKDSSDLKAKHARVEALLKNDIFNHAGVVKELWGDKGASNRSLFRKKLHRELNDNDVPYEFDDKELSKIVNILMDTSKQITKTLGGDE